MLHKYYVKYLMAREKSLDFCAWEWWDISEQLERGEEQRRYRQYLAEQMEEQKQQEAEMEQLMESELQQAWARRQEQWRLEKAARDRLMKDVIDTRRLQIQEKRKLLSSFSGGFTLQKWYIKYWYKYLYLYWYLYHVIFM